MTFHDFHFNQKLQDGLDAMGYEKPTPIQQEAIPQILAKRDLVACAQTGTGKTAAYLLPILHNIIHSDHRHLNTLVIAPTRELVQQIDQQVEGLAYFTGVSSIPIYGGGDGAVWDQQKKALEAGVDLMIATPGRLIAQLASGVIDLKYVQHLVLDEADRMLDMGFYDDILRIIKYLPSTRQTLLFSATMPPRIRALANKILRDPAEINIAISKPADGIVQEAYLVNDDQKEKLITHLLKGSAFSSALIFASTKEKVKHLGRLLPKLGLPSKAIHSDLEQNEREEILREFKNKQLNLLIGTDVLSRGIDVEGIELVLNYDVPPDPEDYIHRIGRTARAASTGHAITFVNQLDQRRFGQIEKLIGTAISKTDLPYGFHPSFAYNPDGKMKPEKPHHHHKAGNKKRFFRKRPGSN
ncbi:MAG: DEAD/DEAH box helicase [Bacteroidetes bacterium]|nr:DEAD/DEAH box helicase [Bacteroidota bacterium]MBS1541793.1 DEAD/DEAH box helicase [Bacteroidota bacterium]